MLPEVEEDLLDEIYDMRCEVAHQGFTTLSFECAAGLATEALTLGRQAILAANDLVDVQDLRREREYILWID